MTLAEIEGVQPILMMVVQCFDRKIIGGSTSKDQSRLVLPPIRFLSKCGTTTVSPKILRAGFEPATYGFLM